MVTVTTRMHSNVLVHAHTFTQTKGIDVFLYIRTYVHLRNETGFLILEHIH
jgi:hypothetical protein